MSQGAGDLGTDPIQHATIVVGRAKASLTTVADTVGRYETPTFNVDGMTSTDVLTG